MIYAKTSAFLLAGSQSPLVFDDNGATGNPWWDIYGDWHLPIYLWPKTWSSTAGNIARIRFATNNAFRLFYNRSLGTINLTIRNTLGTSFPTTVTFPGGLPTNEAMLIVVSFNGTTNVPTLRAMSESQAALEHVGDPITGNMTPSIGWDQGHGGTSSMVGYYGPFPHFAKGQFTQANMEAAFTNRYLFGTYWQLPGANQFARFEDNLIACAGHGPQEEPDTSVNGNGVGARLGDAITANNFFFCDVDPVGGASSQVRSGFVRNSTPLTSFVQAEYRSHLHDEGGGVGPVAFFRVEPWPELANITAEDPCIVGECPLWNDIAAGPITGKQVHAVFADFSLAGGYNYLEDGVSYRSAIGTALMTELADRHDEVVGNGFFSLTENRVRDVYFDTSAGPFQTSGNITNLRSTGGNGNMQTFERFWCGGHGAGSSDNGPGFGRWMKNASTLVVLGNRDDPKLSSSVDWDQPFTQYIDTFFSHGFGTLTVEQVEATSQIGSLTTVGTETAINLDPGTGVTKTISPTDTVVNARQIIFSTLPTYPDLSAISAGDYAIAWDGTDEYQASVVKSITGAGPFTVTFGDRADQSVGTDFGFDKTALPNDSTWHILFTPLADGGPRRIARQVGGRQSDPFCGYRLSMSGSGPVYSSGVRKVGADGVVVSGIGTVNQGWQRQLRRSIQPGKTAGLTTTLPWMEQIFTDNDICFAIAMVDPSEGTITDLNNIRNLIDGCCPQAINTHILWAYHGWGKSIGLLVTDLMNHGPNQWTHGAAILYPHLTGTDNEPLFGATWDAMCRGFFANGIHPSATGWVAFMGAILDILIPTYCYKSGTVVARETLAGRVGMPLMTVGTTLGANNPTANPPVDTNMPHYKDDPEPDDAVVWAPWYDYLAKHGVCLPGVDQSTFNEDGTNDMKRVPTFALAQYRVDEGLTDLEDRLTNNGANVDLNLGAATTQDVLDTAAAGGDPSTFLLQADLDQIADHVSRVATDHFGEFGGVGPQVTPTLSMGLHLDFEALWTYTETQTWNAAFPEVDVFAWYVAYVAGWCKEARRVLGNGVRCGLYKPTGNLSLNDFNNIAQPGQWYYERVIKYAPALNSMGAAANAHLDFFDGRYYSNASPVDLQGIPIPRTFGASEQAAIDGNVSFSRTMLPDLFYAGGISVSGRDNEVRNWNPVTIRQFFNYLVTKVDGLYLFPGGHSTATDDLDVLRDLLDIRQLWEAAVRSYYKTIVPAPDKRIVRVQNSSGTALFHTAAAHGLQVGDPISINETAFYSANRDVDSVPSATTFTVEPIGGGTPTAFSVSPNLWGVENWSPFGLTALDLAGAVTLSLTSAGDLMLRNVPGPVSGDMTIVVLSRGTLTLLQGGVPVGGGGGGPAGEAFSLHGMPISPYSVGATP